MKKMSKSTWAFIIVFAVVCIMLNIADWVIMDVWLKRVRPDAVSVLIGAGYAFIGIKIGNVVEDRLKARETTNDEGDAS